MPICHKRALFVDFKQLKKSQEVVLGDGRSLKTISIETVELELVIDNEEPKKCELHSALYVPDLSYNLLNVAKMTDRGKKVNFYGSKCQVVDKKERVMAIAVKKVVCTTCHLISYHMCKLR